MRWLLGSLKWRRLALGVVVCSLVGVLAAVISSYLLIFGFDQPYFLSGMSYGSRSVSDAPTPGAVSVQRSEGLTVTAAMRLRFTTAAGKAQWDVSCESLVR